MKSHSCFFLVLGIIAFAATNPAHGTEKKEQNQNLRDRSKQNADAMFVPRDRPSSPSLIEKDDNFSTPTPLGRKADKEIDKQCIPLPHDVRIRMNFKKATWEELVQWISEQTCHNLKTQCPSRPVWQPGQRSRQRYQHLCADRR